MEDNIKGILLVSVIFMASGLLHCARVADVAMSDGDSSQNQIDLNGFFDAENKVLNLSGTQLTETTFKLFCGEIGRFIEENGVEKLLLENNQFTTIPLELFIMLFRSNCLRVISLKNGMVAACSSPRTVQNSANISLVFESSIQFEGTYEGVKKILLSENLPPLSFTQKPMFIRINGDLRTVSFLYTYAAEILNFWLKKLIGQM